MATTILVTFRLRRDTAANWTAANPVLKLGEPGLETDTRKIKYGDGVTAWNALGYGLADPVDADLQAIAALVSAANKVPYATGAGTWALADFTAAGRALVDDANAAAQRTTLGLGAAALEAVGTSGAVLGRLNGGNTWSGVQIFDTATPVPASFRSSDANGAYVVWFNSATSTAVGDIGTGAHIVGAGGATSFGINARVGPLVFGVGGNLQWQIESGGALRPASDNTKSIGTASQRISVVYAATGTINTSDERAKRDIGEMPDEWLDAWADVQWSRFRFKDGDRWHTGLVAQQVRDAFKRHGLNACEIGLLCYDKWPAQRPVKAKYDRKGNLIRAASPGEPAGDRWGLRMDECDAMEHALNRRERARMQREIDELRAIVTGARDGDR